MRFFNSDRKILFLHLLLWVFYLTYRLADFPYRLGLKNGLIFVGVPFLFYLVISYAHYFYLLPLWLRQKRVSAYFLWLGALLIVGLTTQLIVENIAFGNFIAGADITFARVLRILWNAAIFILFTSLIKITIDRFQFEARKHQLENEKLIAELNYLKAQINPHFLFNTLHNLHFLIHSHAENAADAVIKLSNIMRYMIYDANQETVLLESEIGYMKDYIHLQSIRLNNAVRINFHVNGDAQAVRIAPLVLFPFLENAFKHGVNDEHSGSWIDIGFETDGRQLSFRVRNSKPDISIAREVSGFGLQNLKKRLQLSYGDGYSLAISETSDVFDAHLVIGPLHSEKPVSSSVKNHR
jgi:sensor histidine kinase YesM